MPGAIETSSAGFCSRDGYSQSTKMSEEPPKKKRKHMKDGEEGNDAPRKAVRYAKREEKKTDPTSFPQVPFSKKFANLVEKVLSAEGSCQCPI